MKNVQVLKAGSATKPWLVYIPRSKSIDGKRVRLKYKNRAEAELVATKMEKELADRDLVDLGEELHRLIAQYKDKLSVEEFRQILESGVKRFGQDPFTLE